MELFRKIIFKRQGSEAVEYPSSFSLEKCISELEKDGFTVNSALRDDVARFGLIEGIVLAMDGNCGLRVVRDYESKLLVIKTVNGLRDGEDPLSKLARAKYDFKPIHL